jgi:hypothetical protein
MQQLLLYRSTLKVYLVKRIHIKYLCKLKLIAVTITSKQSRLKEKKKLGLLLEHIVGGIYLKLELKKRHLLRKKQLQHLRKLKKRRNVNRNTDMVLVLKRNQLKSQLLSNQVHLLLKLVILRIQVLEKLYLLVQV